MTMKDSITTSTVIILLLATSAIAAFSFSATSKRRNKNDGTLISKLFSLTTTARKYSPLSRLNAATEKKGSDSDGMPILPDDVMKYSQVPKQGKVFTSTTIPKGLLKEHTTKAGTWGVINVSKGELEYRISGSGSDEQKQKKEERSECDHIFQLSDKRHGIIQPQRLHQVSPLSDDVEFVVEFYRVPGTGPVDEKRQGL